MIGTVRTMSTQDAMVSQRRVAADLSQRLAQAGQEASTGFKPPEARKIAVPDHLRGFAKRGREIYDYLHRQRMTA